MSIPVSRASAPQGKRQECVMLILASSRADHSSLPSGFNYQVSIQAIRTYLTLQLETLEGVKPTPYCGHCHWPLRLALVATGYRKALPYNTRLQIGCSDTRGSLAAEDCSSRSLTMRYNHGRLPASQLRPRALPAFRPPAVCNSKQHRTDIVPLDLFESLATTRQLEWKSDKDSDYQLDQRVESTIYCPSHPLFSI